MTEEIKKHLEEYNKQNGWSTSEESLIETLKESKTLYSTTISHHRWYDVTFNVVNINEKLICFNWYYFTGDASVKDMDLQFDITSIGLAEEKTRMETYFERIK